MEELNFQIHIGSYDGIMMGFKGNLKNLENYYSFSSTSGSLKTLCLLNKYLFAGGYDEIIRVYDLNKMKEDGQLEGHEGSITCLKGFKNFLFSAGEDGNILVWKVKDWGLLHKITAHNKAVYDIEIHSSGKLMISIGKDQRLIVWNLLNLQKNFTRKFSYEIFKAKFNKTEDIIILMGEKKLHLLNIATNKMIKVLVHEQKIHDFIVYGDKYLIVGDEIGDVYIWDITEKPQEEKPEIEESKEESKDYASYIKFKAHEKRIKQIKLVNSEELDFIITSSSDGMIKIWDILFLIKDQQISHQDLGDKVESVFKIDSRERINCMEVNVSKLEKKNIMVAENVKQKLPKKSKTEKNKKLKKKPEKIEKKQILKIRNENKTNKKNIDENNQKQIMKTSNEQNDTKGILKKKIKKKKTSFKEKSL